MSETYVGEIRLFGGNFAPRGWAMCDGKLLSTQEYDALFSLLGTTYGGDGTSTFALPDLRGRFAVGEGTGPGLTQRYQGAKFGVESVTIISQTMPSHQHRLQATTDPAEVASPLNNVPAKMKVANTTFYEDIDDIPEDEVYPFSPQSVGAAGGNKPHENRMPFLCITHIIALFGTYPPRN